MLNKDIVEVSDEALAAEQNFEGIKLNAAYSEIQRLSTFVQKDLVTAKLNKEVNRVKELIEWQENLDNQAHEVLDKIQKHNRLMNYFNAKLINKK